MFCRAAQFVVIFDGLLNTDEPFHTVTGLISSGRAIDFHYSHMQLHFACVKRPTDGSNATLADVDKAIKTKVTAGCTCVQKKTLLIIYRDVVD